MTIVRYRPADNFDRIFDQLTAGWLSSSAARRTPTPQVSVETRDNGLQITVDLPGVPRDAVSVDVADRALTIAVDHTTDRGQLRWSRVLTLAPALDADHVAARYADGRLTVEVPAAPKPEPRAVRIEIAGDAPAIDTDAVAPADATPAGVDAPEADAAN